mmetsp:Transcript_19527/g.49661  ORF Transcript_19527/g.49661 Transcript_19527/m.49661 type:complete len:240 (-) Transcript_19527:30-749(-)
MLRKAPDNPYVWSPLTTQQFDCNSAGRHGGPRPQEYLAPTHHQTTSKPPKRSPLHAQPRCWETSGHASPSPPRGAHIAEPLRRHLQHPPALHQLLALHLKQLKVHVVATLSRSPLHLPNHLLSVHQVLSTALKRAPERALHLRTGDHAQLAHPPEQLARQCWGHVLGTLCQRIQQRLRGASRRLGAGRPALHQRRPPRYEAHGAGRVNLRCVRRDGHAPKVGQPRITQHKPAVALCRAD